MTGAAYAAESPLFDHPHKGDMAWHNFLNAADRQNPVFFPVTSMCLLRVPRQGVQPGV